LCTIFVGVNWAFLIDLYLLLTIVVFPSLSLTALLWGEVGVAAAVLLRAAMLEVRVTSDGVGLRNIVPHLPVWLARSHHLRIRDRQSMCSVDRTGTFSLCAGGTGES
jgi:hypothetical protein